VLVVGDSFDNPANTNRLNGYTLVDLRAAFPVAAGLELFGRVDNLFDERYETARLFGSPGRAAYAGVRWAR
jgi:vitamin B12 transporter